MYKGEKTNSITHLVGAVFALAALVLLVVFSSLTGDPWKIVSCSIYGSCLFLTFLFSTLYHSLRGRAKKVFQRFDHIAIFLLIAGTYTPYTLISMRQGSGWYIFGLVWALATFGITFKAIFGDRYNLVSTIFYLLCGWTIVLDYKGVATSLSFDALYWLVAGGIIYSLGTFFYLKESQPRTHEVWHLYVLSAAACHFISVFFYVI